MAQASEFLTLLVRTALGRSDAEATGQPSAPFAYLEARDTAAVPAPPQVDAPVHGDAPMSDSLPEFDDGILSVVAEKVMMAWLRNRYQLLYPFALDLRRLDRGQAELLINAMIAAAQADGSFDSKERRRIEGSLSLVGMGDDQQEFLERAIRQPMPLNDILADVRDVQTAALVYAASLMAVDPRKPVNRYYLKYLAARLQLSEELVESLEHRYRPSG